MITLQAVLLLTVGIASTVAWAPNCSVCKYHNNIGFVAGEFCPVYYMCIRNPYPKNQTHRPLPHAKLYRWYLLCCAPGLAWDQEHLTCKRDGKCRDSRHKCPNITSTTDLPCPHKPDPKDKTKYFTSTHEQMMCPWGQIWSQDYCTCILGHGVLAKPCTKILHFGFKNGTFDSHSCHNFAKGDPYGEPTLNGNVLCLNGVDQFLTISFLNNWFAWNPEARTFTMCVWFMPYTANQTAGIVSTNCEMVDPQTGQSGSVVDLLLVHGQLILLLGHKVIHTMMYPLPKKWAKVCIVFNNGVFDTYWNGFQHFPDDVVIDILPQTFAPNTHSATTLGYKAEYGNFRGYIDDFCFFTDAKDAGFVKRCWENGPSNKYDPPHAA